MKNVSFFKRISLFFTYRKTVKNLQKELEKNYNARVDYVGRIYTVLNVPPDLIEEPYNLRKSDIDLIAEKFIKDYSNQLSNYLNLNGLTELYDFYNIEKVDKYSYLLVYGYSLFNSQKFAKNIIFIWIPTIIILGILSFLYFKFV